MPVTALGRYDFHAQIEVAPHYWISASAFVDLHPGDQIVELRFDGLALFERHRSGPFTVADLWVIQGSEEETPLSDVVTREAIPYTEFAASH